MKRFNLFQWAKDNLVKIVAIPTLLNCVSFTANVMIAASDGVIDSNELHQLMSVASGANVAILVVVMAYLKTRK